MYIRQRFPPHLLCVATLPCKIRKCNMLPLFHVERDNYYVQLKFNVRSYVTCHKNTNDFT